MAALGDERDEVRGAALWALRQQGSGAAPAVTSLARALWDADFVNRGLAAIALRDVGPSARLALPDLVARFTDEDDGVRMVAADAIARLGGEAAPAFDALVAACRVQGQHVHVLRSLADALGAIGAPARAALPVLRDLARIPRVQWAAEAAIRRIEGAGGARRQ
jgi:HEAT repeat protein